MAAPGPTLPVTARLRVVEGNGGDLDDIRARIKQVKDEISRVQALPVPSDDLAERIRRHVDALALRAQPVIQGVGDGQALRVLYPLHDHADRITMSGFAKDDGNALLLLALVDSERLAECLLQVAVDGGISAPSAMRACTRCSLKKRSFAMTKRHRSARRSATVTTCPGRDRHRHGPF
jgi:hypothetical protein